MTLQAIIDFLLSVMRDPQARAEFEQNPQAALASAGIEGASAQDVRDAQLQLADRGYVHAAAGGSASGSGSDDPVQEINYTTRHYNVTEDAPDHITNVNNSISNTFVDDRDITIEDSFNSDDDITVIDDSFNKSIENDITAIQDNDTTVVQDNDTIENDITAIQDNDTIEAPQDTGAPQNTGVVGPAVEPAADDAPLPEAEPEPEPEPAADDAADDTGAAEVDAVV